MEGASGKNKNKRRNQKTTEQLTSGDLKKGAAFPQ